MILYDKLLALYTHEQLKLKLGNYTYYYGFYSNKSKDVKLDRIAKVFPTLKEFYSFEDFYNDFSFILKYKELRTIYNVLMSGKKVSEFLSSNKNISNQLYKGFYSESKSFSMEQLPYIHFDYDISKFSFSFFKKHLELYGEKEDLEKFKSKHAIEQKILWEFQKETWHLAFSGLLAEKIRYDIEKAHQLS